MKIYSEIGFNDNNSSHWMNQNYLEFKTKFKKNILLQFLQQQPHGVIYEHDNARPPYNQTRTKTSLTPTISTCWRGLHAHQNLDVTDRRIGQHPHPPANQQDLIQVPKREWLRIPHDPSGRKEMFCLTTHSTHFIYGYMASYIWQRTTQIAREETRCRHMGYSFRVAARVLLYAPSHRQDNTYLGLCYTSRRALAGTRKSSMGPLSDDWHLL